MRNGQQISIDSIPFLSKDVITREDENGMLLFQVPTDEMYYVNEEAYSVLELLDGSITIEEIVEQLEASNNLFKSKSGKHHFMNFVNELKKREIIEIWY